VPVIAGETMQQMITRSKARLRRRMTKDPALDDIVPRRPPTALPGPMSMMDYAVHSPRVIEYHLRSRLKVLTELVIAADERETLGSAPTEKARQSHRIAMRLARYILKHAKDNSRSLDFPGIEILSELKEALPNYQMCGAPANNYGLAQLHDQVTRELEKRIELACV
jgi:hypothetical protein